MRQTIKRSFTDFSTYKTAIHNNILEQKVKFEETLFFFGLIFEELNVKHTYFELQRSTVEPQRLQDQKTARISNVKRASFDSIE